jgi:peptidoglycan/xylan/chitin deacetylase (PgdA/CDA1 family)
MGKGFTDKLIRRLRKYYQYIGSIVYKPIPIFVFHQTGTDFNPLVDYEPIWSSMELFKQNIACIQKKYKVISLKKANMLMTRPILLRRFAVITFDDGYQSSLNAIDYLIENKIPCTWFINTAYLDQKSFSIVDADIYLNHSTERNEEIIDKVEKSKRILPENEYLQLENIILNQIDLSSIISKKYISREKLFSYSSPHLSIGLHGHRHWDSRCLTMNTFKSNLEQNIELLKLHPCYVPYYALAFGAYTQEQTDYLIQIGLTTLLCNNDLIHTKYPLLSRYCADGVDLSKERLI